MIVDLFVSHCLSFQSDCPQTLFGWWTFLAFLFGFCFSCAVLKLVCLPLLVGPFTLVWWTVASRTRCKSPQVWRRAPRALNESSPCVEEMLEAQSIFICQGWQGLKLTFRFPLSVWDRARTEIHDPFELRDLLTDSMVLYYFSAWILVRLPRQRWDDFLCHLLLEKYVLSLIMFFYYLDAIFRGLDLVPSIQKPGAIYGKWEEKKWNILVHFRLSTLIIVYGMSDLNGQLGKFPKWDRLKFKVKMNLLVSSVEFMTDSAQFTGFFSLL